VITPLERPSPGPPAAILSERMRNGHARPILPNNVITFHVKPFARELTKRCIPDGVGTQVSGLARPGRPGPSSGDVRLMK
jgi:hypothetical protein